MEDERQTIVNLNIPDRPIQVQIVDDNPSSSFWNRGWNSLELAKLSVGLLIPLMLFVFTCNTNSALQKSAKIAENDKRIFGQRQNIYDKMAPLLNDIYAYHMYFGYWKQLSPDDIIKRKRELDRVIYSNTPYFDSASELIQAYKNFMDAAFLVNRGWGKDAAIRSNMKNHQKAIDTSVFKWESRWNDLFTGEDKRHEVSDAYYKLLDQVSLELNLRVQGTDVKNTIPIKTLDTTVKKPGSK